jgi:adenine-specific DNA methylase
VTAIAARGVRWKLFAQEYLEPKGSTFDRIFKKASSADVELFAAAADELRSLEATRCRYLPARQIPSTGRWDHRPLIHGFSRYRDLFNERQLFHLAHLGKAVAGVRDEGAKRILSLAFSEHLATNCMYASYAFGYRRISPLFSIHSYRHITRPVELNPWLRRIGRGTFPNALHKVKSAIAFAREPSDLVPQGGRRTSPRSEAVDVGGVSASAREVLKGTSRAAITTKSSADMSEVADQSIDLILTDPPYFDNISYSELSDFYLAWPQCLGIAEPPYNDRKKSAPLEENLAVTTRSIDGVEPYKRELTCIFAECARVLKRTGVCVLTYHHRSERAWWALGEALVRAGLRCTGVIPLRGEGQGGLHSYEGTIKWDAVLVCRPSKARRAIEKGTLVVSPEEIAYAQATASAWAERLGQKPRLGFRAVDHENLLRALIVSRSRVRVRTAGWVPLDKALAQTHGMTRSGDGRPCDATPE